MLPKIFLDCSFHLLHKILLQDNSSYQAYEVPRPSSTLELRHLKIIKHRVRDDLFRSGILEIISLDHFFMRANQAVRFYKTGLKNGRCFVEKILLIAFSLKIFPAKP